MSDQLLERVQHLERDTRVRLHAVGQEVTTERAITRDLVEALQVRIDHLEASMTNDFRAVLKELREIKAAVTGNGHE